MPFLIKIEVAHRLEGCSTVTTDDLLALEQHIMSVLSDKLAALKTSVDELKTRVDAAVPAQADLDAIDAMKTEVDNISPAPVVPPTPEPSPTPTP